MNSWTPFAGGNGSVIGRGFGTLTPPSFPSFDAYSGETTGIQHIFTHKQKKTSQILTHAVYHATGNQSVKILHVKN